jgi:agmatine deiminase
MMTRRTLLQLSTAAAITSPFADILGTGGVMASEKKSARQAGFRMPLESEPHERTFMQWPSKAALYGNRKGLDAVRSRVALVAKSIASFEPVVVLARPEQKDAAIQSLGSGIDVWPIETEDLWCRDSGPGFVRTASGQLAIFDLNFNGWGNKQVHADDGRIAKRVAERLGMPIFNNGVVGEGGGIEIDGAGTVIAHESSWVNANRNNASKADIERRILDALGADKMIWARGLKGADITDYHIDAVARFVKPGLIVIQLARTVDRSDPWTVAAYETYEVLKSATDAQGRKFDIAVIHDPVKIRSKAPDFVSSYVNYYVCNGGVISAEFGDDTADAAAKATLEQLYPGRKVVSLNIDPICEAGGGIHCSTQQQPKTSV